MSGDYWPEIDPTSSMFINIYFLKIPNIKHEIYFWKI